MSLLEKKVLVIGLGKSGLSVTRWLSGEGAEVTVSEMKEKAVIDNHLVNEILELGVKLETGGHKQATFLASDMIIVSPGVPLDLEPLATSREKGIPVLGEMELAGRLIDIPLVAITGTNGKSTTTSLVGSMITNAGFRVFVGGNIGTPLMDYVMGDRNAEFVVVEISSFQLDTIEKFCPAVSLLLNISPDHLDRYSNYEAYVQSKLKIFQNQGPGQYAILNDEDDVLSQLDLSGGISVLRYGMGKKKNRHAFIEGKKMIAFLPEMEPQEFDIERYRLPGVHNLENLMAGVLTGLALKIEPAVIQNTIEHFTSLSHRLELVGSISGVTFYNDSKATNVDAALSSINSFDRSVILIAGGRHKGGDYSPLADAAKGRVRKAVLLGESKKILAKAFEGFVPFTMAESMTDAVSQAFSSAEKDDVVLLAPACSSFDMFSDYGQRGTVFREAVERLRDGG
jgi:UDP-N-acetylmuramoylalanine--D-glutamate ligase